MNKRQTGSNYEDVAERYMLEHGFLIVERNYVCPVGEIDLVARKGSIWCFVEVKYRKGSEYGFAAEAVTFKKQQKLVKTADRYIRQRKLNPNGNYRFDVMAIQGRHIEYIENAYGGM